MWRGHGQYQIPGGINRLWAAQAAAATQVPGIPLSFLAATFGSEDDNTSSQAMSRLEFKKRSLESETLEEKWGHTYRYLPLCPYQYSLDDVVNRRAITHTHVLRSFIRSLLESIRRASKQSSVNELSTSSNWTDRVLTRMEVLSLENNRNMRGTVSNKSWQCGPSCSTSMSPIEDAWCMARKYPK